MERYVPLKETMRFGVQQVVSFKGTTCYIAFKKSTGNKLLFLVVRYKVR